jgi:hypothetical protein
MGKTNLPGAHRVVIMGSIIMVAHYWEPVVVSSEFLIDIRPCVSIFTTSPFLTLPHACPIVVIPNSSNKQQVLTRGLLLVHIGSHIISDLVLAALISSIMLSPISNQQEVVVGSFWIGFDM